MAENYCQCSMFINVQPSKIEQAKSIVNRVCEHFESDSEHPETDDQGLGFVVSVEAEGVWIREDNSVIPEHVETLVRALVEELGLDGIYVCSWAYTCSKLRTDEFGGGAFAVVKGEDTEWIGDAASEVRRIAATKL